MTKSGVKSAKEIQSLLDKYFKVLVVYIPYNTAMHPQWFRPTTLVKHNAAGGEVSSYEKRAMDIEGIGELYVCGNEAPIHANTALLLLLQYHADNKRRKLKL